jgi:hypothetical protein
MNKILLILCAVIMTGSVVEAKCTRQRHQKSAVVVKEGRRIDSQEYICQVKGNEKQYFEDKYCKFCGCHRVDHDNT